MRHAAELKILDLPTRSELLVANYSNKRFAPHFHSSYSIGVITQGSCDFVCDGQGHTAFAGDICVIHPYQIHTGGTDGGTLEYQMIYPSVHWIASICKKSLNQLPLFASPVIQDSRSFKSLLQVLAQNDSVGAHADEWCLALERAIRLLINKHAVSEGEFPSPSECPGSIGLACHYLESRWRDSISFSELAKSVGLSQFHFSRQFKKKTGVQPRHYLRQIRLDEAKKMICSGVDLANTSVLAGFSDQAHMTREFQKVYGITPGQIAVLP